MTPWHPDARLRSAADLVRQGAVFADIGTDHAYLPLFLLEEGRIVFAVCADINEGPLASARAHAAQTPFLDRCEFVLTDGLRGIEGRGVTDVAICGMGGELISRIVAEAAFVRDPDIRLILGPMTKQEFLRTSLSQNGFCITEEVYAHADRKNYVTLCARYDGVARSLSVKEAVLGIEPQAHTKDPDYVRYLQGKEKAYARSVAGKRKGGEDVRAEEEEVLLAIRDQLKLSLHI